jgi:hypothetical protein
MPVRDSRKLRAIERAADSRPDRIPVDVEDAEAIIQTLTQVCRDRLQAQRPSINTGPDFDTVKRPLLIL